MADELEELFVEQVSVGVADMDLATENDVISTRVVVQRTTASDAKTGEDRELLLVYGAEEVPAVADALHQAAERASAEQS
jgi:hypothetical protein